MPRRGAAAKVELEELILAAEARAAAACRDHDRAAEWQAECELYELWEQRASLPTPRRPAEP